MFLKIPTGNSAGKHLCWSLFLIKLQDYTFFYRTPLVATFETKHMHASAAVLLHIRTGNLDWNESHEKETKHIHASAANLLHIRVGNLNWCECGHCKNKAREIDCLCCR